MINHMILHQCPGRCLSIIGQFPSVSDINWLHVDMFQFFFVYMFLEYAVNSSYPIGSFLEFEPVNSQGQLVHL